jgi:hypothetical protein
MCPSVDSGLHVDKLESRNESIKYMTSSPTKHQQSLEILVDTVDTIDTIDIIVI